MDHTQLVSIIQNMTGVYLTEDKIYLLDTRLRDLMKENNLQTYNEVGSLLLSGRNESFKQRLIDQITTHETRFFRDESIFNALVDKIVPEWLERRGIHASSPGNEILTIWSAACSTGQEPYSIALMIRDRFPMLYPNLRIIATDISQESIDRAKAGYYTNFEIQRGMPAHILIKYFSQDEKGARISDELKSKIEFKVHNLIADQFPQKCDFVFCRNVLIYFDDTTRKSILEKIRSSLKPDGALILGSSENLIGSLPNYIVREAGLARYYEFSSQVTFFK